MIEEVKTRVSEKIKDLDGIIALRHASEGTAPHLYKNGDDISTIVLAPVYPLASVVSLLQKRFPEARFGIVARACDIKAMVEMVKRKQIDPERLYIIGVACSAEEVNECHCADPELQIEGWPHAELIGTPEKGKSPDEVFAKYDAMSLEEKREFWQQQFLKCIKCYGCRNICPECFCNTCALESGLWVERGELAPPFPMFHLIKAMHMSNRCIACRQCELACPANIPLTTLYQLMRRDVAELMEYVPGENLESKPPLVLTLEDAPLKKELIE